MFFFFCFYFFFFNDTATTEIYTLSLHDALPISVKQRIHFNILLFVFKAIHGSAPHYLSELVAIKQKGRYNLRSSSNCLFLATTVRRSRVTLGDRSFQVAAPTLWNALSREIHSITDFKIFKCHLKTYLFKEAFY